MLLFYIFSFFLSISTICRVVLSLRVVVRGIGLSPPLDQLNLLILGGFQAPKGDEPLPPPATLFTSLNLNKDVNYLTQSLVNIDEWFM